MRRGAVTEGPVSPCHACRVGNVTLPTPLVVAGAALCALAGALVGFVLSPDSSHDSTATVASFDAGDNRLCLSGDAVAEEPGVDAYGQLCGTWRRPQWPERWICDGASTQGRG